jgi:hypothetical protein
MWQRPFGLEHTHSLSCSNQDGPKDGPVSILGLLLGWQPLDHVAAYFGARTAWYFVWLGFYTRSLILPAFIGFAVFVLSYVMPELPTLAIYSVLISLWAAFYVELWKREECRIAYVSAVSYSCRIIIRRGIILLKVLT